MCKIDKAIALNKARQRTQPSRAAELYRYDFQAYIINSRHRLTLPAGR